MIDISEVPGRRKRKGPRRAADPSAVTSEPGQEITSPSHDEWLLDEALAETFPASDPISPSIATRARSLHPAT